MTTFERWMKEKAEERNMKYVYIVITNKNESRFSGIVFEISKSFKSNR